MFSFARFIIRHKIIAIAAIAAGVFFMTPSKEETEAPSSPWAIQRESQAPLARAEEEEGGIVDDMLTEATEFLDDNGINPLETADETAGRFDDVASAYSNANR